MSASKSRLTAICGFAVAASLVAGVSATGDFDTPTNGAPQAVKTVNFVTDGVTATPSSTRITAPSRVYVNSRIPVSGVVKVRPGRSRVVVLQERTGSGYWRSVAKTRTTRGGVFRMTVAAGSSVKTKPLRLYAPRAYRLTRIYTTPLLVRVVARPVVTTTPAPSDPAPSEPAPTTPAEPTPTDPAPAGEWDPAEAPSASEPATAGSATDWSFLFDDGGARWNPCEVIDWTYDPTGSYTGSVSDMKRAFARISGRTGLHFRYAGPMDYRAYETNNARPAGVEVVIGWSTAARNSSLSGSTVGVGGGQAQGARSGSDVKYKITTGRIALDSEASLRPGFTTSGNPTWGQIMEHEALHVLGLGHATGSSQLMYGAAHSGNHLYGAGDAAGMKRIGADQGCLS